VAGLAPAMREKEYLLRGPGPPQRVFIADEFRNFSSAFIRVHPRSNVFGSGRQRPSPGCPGAGANWMRGDFRLNKSAARVIIVLWEFSNRDRRRELGPFGRVPKVKELS